MRRSRLTDARAVRRHPFLGIHGSRRSAAEGSACFDGAFCHQGHPAIPELVVGSAPFHEAWSWHFRTPASVSLSKAIVGRNTGSRPPACDDPVEYTDARN